MVMIMTIPVTIHDNAGNYLKNLDIYEEDMINAMTRPEFAVKKDMDFSSTAYCNRLFSVDTPWNKFLIHLITLT